MLEKGKKVLILVCAAEIFSLCVIVFFHRPALDYLEGMRSAAAKPPQTITEGIKTSGGSSVEAKPVTEPTEKAGKKWLKISAAGKMFDAEVADTNELRQKGLSGRKSLDADKAMLFTFDAPDYYGFWMKNMKFPIDIIWLDAARKIIYMEKDVRPESYPEGFRPDKKASYVIEFSAGIADELGLRLGDTVVMP